MLFPVYQFSLSLTIARQTVSYIQWTGRRTAGCEMLSEKGIPGGGGRPVRTPRYVSLCGPVRLCVLYCAAPPCAEAVRNVCV